MTTPLATRLRQAAATIAELNSRQGLSPERASVSPEYLLAAADEVESALRDLNRRVPTSLRSSAPAGRLGNPLPSR
jgi:hypothetical protein